MTGFLPFWPALLGVAVGFSRVGLVAMDRDDPPAWLALLAAFLAAGTYS